MAVVCSMSALQLQKGKNIFFTLDTKSFETCVALKINIHWSLVCTQSILTGIKQTAQHRPTKGETASPVSCQKTAGKEAQKMMHCAFRIYSETQLADVRIDSTAMRYKMIVQQSGLQVFSRSWRHIHSLRLRVATTTINKKTKLVLETTLHSITSGRLTRWKKSEKLLVKGIL